MASPSSRPETPPVSNQKPGASSFKECGNCRAAMTGPYCSQCGEKKLTPKDYSLSHLVEEVLGEFAHFDTKFLRTLKVLLTKPGELSKAYFHGGRSRYTKPLTLFVIINVIFFVAQPHTTLWHQKLPTYMEEPRYATVVVSHLNRTKEPQATYAIRFNANLQDQKKSLLIVSVPILALMMSLVFIRTRRTYAEHLVFSVQVYAIELICLLAGTVIILTPLRFLLRFFGSGTAPLMTVLDGEGGIAIIMITVLTIYMYHGLRRGYYASRIRASLSAFALALMVLYLTGIYYRMLFWATYWTT